MDPLNFLSTEVVAGIIIVGALVMTVRSILMFTGEMAPKVQKLDMMLNKIRDGMAEKKKIVKDLAVIVDPLRAREGKLRDYYEQIKEIELTYERESAEKGEKDEAEKRKRIQRKKMGFD
ncbi:MAG: hypothetical protein VYD18_14580 [Candidatus Latescibacterota bacterium]|nr:hypothetical protein [Candidatus Latescibacterota bacterium]